MRELIINRITYWDIVCFMTIFRLNGRRFLSRIVLCISHTGDGYLYPVIAFFAYCLSETSVLGFLLAGCIAYIIELSTYKIAKNKVKRNRPFKTLDGIQNMVAPIDQFSFPSGHTAAAFIMATLLYYFFPPLAILAYPWAFSVGFARIYLGVHYPSDILAGIALGLISAAAGIYLSVLMI